mgnify:CR=1 FL=1
MIRIEGLAKTFAAPRAALFGRRAAPVQAVRDVSFSAADGRITGLLGPNGAGKTTTLRMLAGLIAPDAGTLEVDGVGVAQRPREALAKMGDLFSAMYEADSKGGRPSVAPEKLLRAMLLQILYSVRSERQLMEQVRYNLLFRWFIGLSMDDVVWVPTVFTKNRERLIEHDAVIEFFNEVVAIAQEKELLSGEHFSVDGTLIQAWASHKSFVPKSDDESDGGGGGGNFKGEKRSNETHESKTDADARLYRKGNTASELRFMGHTLSDNRHGLIASAVVTTADGYAEREAAEVMISDARQALGDPEREITLGADKGYDAQEFIDTCIQLGVKPHVAQNKSGRKSAVPDAIARSEGYALSQRKRKLIEQGFGWAKTVGGIRQVMVRGLKRVDQMFVLNMAAFNLVRMRTLGQVRPQGAQ